MGFVLAIALLIIFIYTLYYKPKYNKRLKTNPSSQSKLNYEFRVLDGWLFLRGKIYASALSFFGKRSKLINNHYDDLSSPKLQKKYDKDTEKFLKRSKKKLATYLKYSEHIEKFNAKHNNDSKKEIFRNNQEAIKFLAQVQNKIKTNPSDYLYLSIASKEDPKD
jgi:hypothetical protein